MVEQVAQKMQYVFLGNSGLKVSRISFGNWLNSNDAGNQEKTTQLVKTALDLGINFFDTAEVYGDGEAERQFGVAFQTLNIPRESIVVSTKIFWGPDRKKNVNDIGLSRKHIIEGLKGGLKRLQLSYADIVFCHRFDEEVTVEETCRAFDSVIKQGLTSYWGTSEWSAANIFEAFMVCEKYNLVKPIADQCQYNMFVRDKMEVDYLRLFKHYNYGTTIWSPLAGGMLTGKYNNGIPEGSRVATFSDNPIIQNRFQQYFSEANKPKYTETFQGLAQIAQELGTSQAVLAMAWVLKYSSTSTAITGSTKPEQLIEIVTAVSVQDKLTPEILDRIEKLLKNRPDPGYDFRSFGLRKTIR